MSTATAEYPVATVYGTPSCVQCKSVVRTITTRTGQAPTYVDLSTDEIAADYVRANSNGDLRLPFVAVQMPNGENLTFSGNRRDLLDELFPRAKS